MTEDFVAVAKWLKIQRDSKGKLGVVGFCFGGGMVNQLAVRLAKSSMPASPSMATRPASPRCQDHRTPDVPRRRCAIAKDVGISFRKKPGGEQTDIASFTDDSHGFSFLLNIFLNHKGLKVD